MEDRICLLSDRSYQEQFLSLLTVLYRKKATASYPLINANERKATFSRSKHVGFHAVRAGEQML